MGFFALTSRGVAGQIDVLAAHLCLWVLPKRYIGRTFFFDVGLRLHATGSAVRRFRVALPFVADTITDLSAIVLDAQFNPLIFGRPVRVNGDRITYDATQLEQGNINDRVIAVSVTGSTRDDHGQGDDGFCTWSVELDNPISANETVYVRFRFPIADPFRIWFSKGWSLAKGSYVVDLRVADVRESVLLGIGRNEVDHIVAIRHLFLFVITPAHFTPQHISPTLHYSRLLEGNVWQPYLASCGRFNRRTKLSIHQWRKIQDHDPVTVTNPFIGYMDVMRDAGFETAFYYFVAIVLTGALANGLHLIPAYISLKIGGVAAVCLLLVKWVETRLR